MWMYRNNAVNIDETIENGALVDIITTTGRYLGTGFISKNSHITVRILSKDINEIFDRNIYKRGTLMKRKYPKVMFDIIVLDPPAFTKSRRTVDHAYNGYKKINMKAMKLLGRGGYLITCSCSRFMETDNFEKMLRESAHEAGVTLKQVSVTQQNPDHPILWTMEETSYLKFYIFQII